MWNLVGVLNSQASLINIMLIILIYEGTLFLELVLMLALVAGEMKWFFTGEDYEQ